MHTSFSFQGNFVPENRPVSLNNHFDLSLQAGFDELFFFFENMIFKLISRTKYLTNLEPVSYVRNNRFSHGDDEFSCADYWANG